jgi:hypothetical protein
MSTSKRAKDAKRQRNRPSEPFMWLRSDLLVSSKICRLSASALQYFLLLNANYQWLKQEAFLSYGTAVKHMDRGRKTICNALTELKEAELILLKRPGTRPNTAGGALGKATVWRLPFREPGEHPKLELPPGLKRPQGHFVWHCSRVRADVQELSGSALKALVFLVGERDRTRDGAVASMEPFSVSAAHLVRFLPLSPATAKRTLRELVETGRLLQLAPPSGRRAGTYLLGRAYANPPRQARSRKTETEFSGEPHDADAGSIESP